MMESRINSQGRNAISVPLSLSPFDVRIPSRTHGGSNRVSSVDEVQLSAGTLFVIQQRLLILGNPGVGWSKVV